MKKKEKISTVVYSTLVADLFHYGHLQLLKFANSQGDYHICGLLTDKAAKYYKKNLISNFKEREAIALSLEKFMDEVITQDEADPTENLKKIHEKFKGAQIILVHGDDWKTIPGSDYIKKIGGKVVKHPYYTGLSDFKIINALLKRYEGKFKNFEEFTRYFDLKDFTYFNPRKIEDTVFSSKADTLRYLRPLLKKSKIEKTFVFVVFDWKEEKDDIIKSIKEKFVPSKIVVRSSTISEDAVESSMAGCFHSELNVPSQDTKKIEAAVNKVIGSYNEKKSDYMINQILIQPHTQDVAISGVIFTRGIEDNSPYYVINYDDQTGSTDSVTKGLENKTIKILRFCDTNDYPEKLKKLVFAIKEIESIIPNISLDIEFAINKKDEIIIFQVRSIAVNSKLKNQHDERIKEKIQELKQQFEKMSERKSHLAGNDNCFGDMPDWNPAEIIGDNPNYLDSCLYDYVITDSAWHQARTSQGYTNVNPAKLVILFGNKPYVDVRNTFNSFIPAAIPDDLRQKLIEFYMEKLRNNPELQDKVEFEVLYTCYDLSFDKRSKELLNAGFTKNDVNELKQSLLSLTNKLIVNSKKSIEEDMNSVLKMENLRENIKVKLNSSKDSPKAMLKEAKRLLDDCKTNGTVQFSRLARLAFIGNIILKSMIKEEVIDKNFYDSFMGSIETVAKKMNNDFNLFLQGKINQKQFLKLYGHLRPGTYDITSLRYDKNPGLLKSQSPMDMLQENKSTFKIADNIYKKITESLKEHQIETDAEYFLGFVRSAIESRELSKFEFTKSLSNAIELIAESGKLLGFSRNEVSQLGINSLFNILESDESEITKKWKKTMDKRVKEKELNDLISLPPTLFSKKDFDIISPYFSRSNFITQKKIEGQIADITNVTGDNIPQLKGKIVLLENGDPGYDWIFTKNPAGLITKYGGVASHMAIRAAEFKLPAAIGCGEIFDKVGLCNSVILDCAAKKITPLR
jgi:glycerol-3-phosphate cytidylyltransferase-like family protein/phosphohistidine swiveling domain-containing protein